MASSPCCHESPVDTRTTPRYGRDVGAEAGDDGRIPITLWIGVTGHRALADPEALRAPVREAIDRFRGLLPGREVEVVAVSALAEGADRLVAEEVLAVKKARLEVALPLAKEDYLDDFPTEESKKEFGNMLLRSACVWTAPAALSRKKAYEQAGRYVVDRSDAVIALWDGEPSRGQGGTAEIVSYARQQKVPLAWVKTNGEPTVSYEIDAGRADVLKDAQSKLDEYNAAMVKPGEYRKQLDRLREELIPEVMAEPRADPLKLSREKVTDWLFPYLIRADVLALRYQHRFRLLSWLIFALAAGAVTVVAVQANFLPGLSVLAAIEVAFLVGLLSILLMNRRWRLYDQWISCRFLAERLRSSYFLALAGTGDRKNRPMRLVYFSDSSEAWIERALTEVAARRPSLDHRRTQVTPLRNYLSRYWIGGQIDYHHKASRRQRTFDDRLVHATEALFLLTLVAACIHTFGGHALNALGVRGHDSREFWEKLIIVVSITVPAIGAAVHGIGTQRQFRRQSVRFHRMEGLLAQVQHEMDDATTLKRIREVAAETEQLMREENSDWFGVMRFHDIELIT